MGVDWRNYLFAPVLSPGWHSYLEGGSGSLVLARLQPDHPSLRHPHFQLPESQFQSRKSFLWEGTTRAEDAQGTPTQSHISPSIQVYEDKSSFLDCSRSTFRSAIHTSNYRRVKFQTPDPNSNLIPLSKSSIQGRFLYLDHPSALAGATPAIHVSNYRRVKFETPNPGRS